ncbi:hypothetical protein MATL_G00222700 [Megalops atlanticus]|uniref:Uncharacterized protein n=1 Tax=Megalops atlanticus TaxID=7932 RepID=A0A9D3T2P2_MEGAT|nr:hypothetical protein MATL_G00222700 [Megalops atlanticus]
MKKTRSTNLRRAWPSSDFSDRASERTRSRSEKDYRLHKHHPPPLHSQSPRGYVTPGVRAASLPTLAASCSWAANQAQGSAAGADRNHPAGDKAPGVKLNTRWRDSGLPFILSAGV